MTEHEQQIEIIETKNGHGVRRLFRNEHGEIIDSRYLTSSDLNSLLTQAHTQWKVEVLKHIQEHSYRSDEGWYVVDIDPLFKLPSLQDTEKETVTPQAERSEQ